MGKVFISYSRRDTEVVKGIVSQLEAENIEVWFDTEDIKAGKQWRKQIVEGIDTADAFILNLSPDSAASVNVLKELNLAEESLDPFILPIMLKEMQLPEEMRYQLAGTQFIAYHLDPQKGVQDLITEIKKRKNALAENPPAEAPAFRDIELVLDTPSGGSLSKEAQQKLLESLGEIIGTSIVGVETIDGSIVGVESKFLISSAKADGK
jgi:hypothetical protein